MSLKKAAGEKFAQKLNISVSGELFERLKPVKRQFSISGVCQNAIEREVKTHELRIIGSNISRLKAEKEKYDQKYLHAGKVAGISGGGNMSYLDLVFISSNSTDKRKYYDRAMANIPIDDIGFNKVLYFYGWICGVQMFYKEYKSLI